MALSGSFGYTYANGYRLQLEWAATQDIAANQSTINASLYWISMGSQYYISSSSTKDGYIEIDGSRSSFSGAGLAGLSANQKKRIHSWSKTVTHGADGTKSLTLAGMFDPEVNVSGAYLNDLVISSNITLNTIPRASTLSSTTPPSWTAGYPLPIKINRADSSFVHDIWIYVNNVLIRTIQDVGASVDVQFTTAENEAIFTELAKDTTSFDQASRIEIRTQKGSTIIGETKVYTGTVSSPRASTLSAPEYFYVGDSFGVSVSRVTSSFTHLVKLRDGGTLIKQYEGISTGVTVTTSDKVDLLNSLMPDTTEKSILLEVFTYYGSTLVRKPTTIAIAARITGAEPVFGNEFTYADINTVTINLTGDATKIVQNKSNVRVSLPVSALAVPQDGASMVEYIATMAGKEVVKAHTGAALTFEFGTIAASSNVTLSIKAVDSRGLTTTATKTVTMLPYSNPSVNATATRLNNFESTTTLRVSGTISPLTVNGVNKNAIQQVQYRWRESSGTFPSIWTNFTYQFSGSSYTASQTLEFDPLKTYEIQYQVSDKLGNVMVSRTVSEGTPNFFIGTNRKVGIGKFPSATNPAVLDVNGAVAASGVDGQGGTLALGANNTTKISLDSDLYNAVEDFRIIDKNGNVFAKALSAASATLTGQVSAGSLRLTDHKMKNGWNIATIRDGVTPTNTESILIQMFEVDMPITSGQAVHYVDLTYPTAFDSDVTPRVVVTPYGTNSSGYPASTQNSFYNSVRIYVAQFDRATTFSGTIKVHLIAIGRKS